MNDTLALDLLHPTADLGTVVERASQAERLGFSGLFTTEALHDPLLPLVVAAEHTERIDVGTDVAIALARNPMSTAIQASDLQRWSRGRLVLGLGTQIRPHIRNRYSMPWSRPADRMREFVLALRAIWATWYEGATLDFRGELYTHTLMTPFFDPGPDPHGPPPVMVAAVGERMLRVVGEVADGLMTHPMTTRDYLDRVATPHLSAGAAAAGRRVEDLAVVGMAIVATGGDDREVAAAADAARLQVAFYASTPAYRPILELHGLGDLQPDANELSKQGRWREMAGLVTDDVLDTFAVRGAPAEVGAALAARYRGSWDRVSLSSSAPLDDETLAAVVEGCRRG